MNKERNTSVAFFDAQFEKQIAQHDFALNPFEQAALPYVRGSVLDLGCGMGNLSVQAARAGHKVHALDASEAAIAHLRAVAQAESLPLSAALADLRSAQIEDSYDTVICIGLLMFFDCETARRQLAHLKSRVRPGGVAVINVLVEGTSYMAMFGPEGHCLFGRDELPGHFEGWRILSHEHSVFAAPGGTEKVFATLVAELPG